MNRQPPPLDEHTLGELLRRGDPAAGRPGLAGHQLHGIRHALEVRLREVRTRGHRLRLAAVGAIAAALLAAVVLGLWPGALTDGAPAPALTGLEPGATAGDRYAVLWPEAGGQGVRQIQFLAPGGTRIVWFLIPDTE